MGHPLELLTYEIAKLSSQLSEEIEIRKNKREHRAVEILEEALEVTRGIEEKARMGGDIWSNLAQMIRFFRRESAEWTKRADGLDRLACFAERFALRFFAYRLKEVARHSIKAVRDLEDGHRPGGSFHFLTSVFLELDQLSEASSPGEDYYPNRETFEDLTDDLACACAEWIEENSSLLSEWATASQRAVLAT